MSFYIEDILFQSCFDANDQQFKNCLAISVSKTLSVLIVNVVATAYDGDTVKMISLVRSVSNLDEGISGRDSTRL